MSNSLTRNIVVQQVHCSKQVHLDLLGGTVKDMLAELEEACI